MKPRPPWLRNTVILILLVFATLASGCVYLRLLRLKNQLAEFEKNFSVDTADGIRLHFKDPVLLGDDLRWLGAEPETTRRNGSSEDWTVRWVKTVPPGVKEEKNYDVTLNAAFLDHQLQSLHVPEQYFAFVPKNLFLNALRSAGHARIDREHREAELDTAPIAPGDSFSAIQLSSMEKMLGVPTQQTEQPDNVSYRYVFRPQTPRGPGRPIEVTFIFAKNSGTLRKLVSKLPKGTLTFDFPEAVPASTETPPPRS